MKNFGKLKTIVENTFITSYGKPEFKKIVREFKEFMSDKKSVAKVYLDYGTLMKTHNLNETVAKELIDLERQVITKTISENKKDFIEFENWVETLQECEANNYELLDNIIYAKTAQEYITMIESKNSLVKILTEKKIEEPVIRETIKIPIEDMFRIASETFGNEYSTLSESEQFEIRSILRMTPNELTEGIERLKKEVITKLDAVQSSDDETKTKINETKERVLNTTVDSLSYYKLKNLSEGL